MSRFSLAQKCNRMPQRTLYARSPVTIHPTHHTPIEALRHVSSTTSHPSMAAVQETVQAPLVICQESASVGEFTLNRPSKMNALNFEMFRAITPQLQAWENSGKIKIITVKSEPGVAFCAGGDAKAVVDYAKAGIPEKSFQFFKEEYQLDHMISALNTPYVAIIDGVTMGGGVGISAHSAFRIATENTLFAMPETKIGFFPDVGGSFFLPRLDGYLGVYLGLTGKRLKGTDTLYAGVATHYVPSHRLPELEVQLAQLGQDATYEKVDRTIEAFSGDLDQAPDYSLGHHIRCAIDRCFQYDHMDHVIAAIEKERDRPELKSWAEETLKYLHLMSPTSLTVALEALRRGRTQTIIQCFQMEFHLLQKFLVNHDMHEGVYKTLVHRGQTSYWDPPTLTDIHRDTILSKFFDSPSPWPTLEMISTKDFDQYPHRQFVLPTEHEIKTVVVEQGPWTCHDQILDHFVKARQGKQGVKQKVKEVLDCRTLLLDTTVQWVD